MPLNPDSPADQAEASPPPRFAPGAFIDHYCIIRPLGSGGMADVFLARDTHLGRKVAIKVVQPDRLKSKSAVDRFLFEARTTARFNHPHIVTVYQVGETDGCPYLVLEYVEGQSLRERLKQERLSEPEAVRIALAIAEAVVQAHAENLLHRDLKPENVMIGRDGTVRVLDFGLALLLEEPQDASRLAESEQASLADEAFRGDRVGVIGTPAYMAPEQWKQAEVGPATDVWAIGLILYEALSGQHPYAFVQSERALTAHVCSDNPVPSLYRHGQFTPGLVELVHRSVAKKSAERPTAQEVDRELDLLLRGRERPVDVDQPFRGLLPFHEEHAGLFFGRETEVAEFVERLRVQPVMVVVGPSGAGKSSFVRAGVLPRLRERGPLLLLQLRPGRDPFLALASKLIFEWEKGSEESANKSIRRSSLISSTGLSSHDGLMQEAHTLTQRLRESPGQVGEWLRNLAERYQTTVVLFVDQLEELCAVEDREVQQAFMTALAMAADDDAIHVRVVVTVREEFLGRLVAGSQQVQEAMRQTTFLRQPDHETLKKMFTRPLLFAGYRYDDSFLVTDMVEEVAHDAACLPLLQFAAQKLWEGRDEGRRVIKRSAYEALGGVAGSLAEHADGVLAGMTAAEVDLARRILLMFVTADNTRRLLQGHELLRVVEGDGWKVVERLVDARLVLARKGEREVADYELVHESLIGHWNRYRKWIEESREERQALEQLTVRADLWTKNGKRPEDTLQGQSFREAREIARRSAQLGPEIQEFLAASERRGRRRRQLLVGAVAFVALLLAGSGLAVEHLRKAGLCKDSEVRLRGVWDEPKRQAVAAAFLSSGRPYAHSTFERVVAHLDGWTREWVAAHTGACEATAVSGTQSEKVLDLRMGCLERKLRSLQALVGVFVEKPDGQLVDKAVEATLGLGGIAFCSDVKALEQQEEPPERLEDRRTLSELRGRLEVVNQLDKLGKYGEAEALLKALTPRVLALGFPPLKAELAYYTASNLERLGKYTEAERVFVESIQAAQQSGMKELAALAESYAARVVGYHLQRYAEGLLYALYAQGHARGLGDEVEARSLNNLANIYHLQGKYREVEELYEKARTIREKALGSEHPSVAESLNNLAVVYSDQGKYGEAEELHKKALAIREKAFGPDHPYVALSLDNVALVYSNQAKYGEAEELYKRALAITEKALGSDHPEMAWSLNKLGDVYHKQGKDNDAKELYKRALAIFEKAFGPDHPLVAWSQSNLGIAYSMQGKYGEAEELEKRALAIFEKAVGPDHPYVAELLVGLGETYEKQHRLAKAQPLLERARAIREKAGVAPGERATSAFALARVLGASGKDRARARSLAQEALDLFQTAGPGALKERSEVERWIAEHK